MAQGDWRPIETAPKDGTVVLLWDGASVRAGSWDSKDPKYKWAFFEGDPAINGMPDGRWGPTHWMPLPGPPESEGESDE